jgi:hypothetical protein
MRGGRGEERRAAAAAAAARVCDRSVNPLRQAVCLGRGERREGAGCDAMATGLCSGISLNTGGNI